MTFEEAAKQLMANPDRSCGSGVSEQEIDLAASTLGVAIRGGYREFLRRFGWGGVPGYRLYGLGDDVPEHAHLVRTTQSERTEMEPSIPHHLLPFWNNGAGDHACLDTGADANEPPVVMWYHEDGPDQTPEQEAPDFGSWLVTALATRAE